MADPEQESAPTSGAMEKPATTGPTAATNASEAGETAGPAEASGGTTMAPAEVLSQADIDRMVTDSAALANVGGGKIFSREGLLFDASHPPRVEPYDFTNPAVIEECVMRILQQRHADFAAMLSARLAIFLRMDVALKLQRVSTQVYRQFTASVGNPSHVVLFKLEPVAGVGVLDIAPSLGLSLVDRMLGGKGIADPNAASLTEIEMNLLDDINRMLLEDWSRLWSSEDSLTPVILGRENGGRYLQTSASDTVMLVAVFEGSIGECSERLQLAIPFPSVEPLVRRLSKLLPAASDKKSTGVTALWRSTYNSIPLTLSVEWDACELSVREIIDLWPGHVVRLPREILRATRVRLADRCKFVGEIGVEQGRLAIRIDQTISPEEV